MTTDTRIIFILHISYFFIIFFKFIKKSNETGHPKATSPKGMPKYRLAHSGFDRLRLNINANLFPTHRALKTRNNLAFFTYTTAICNIVYR